MTDVVRIDSPVPNRIGRQRTGAFSQNSRNLRDFLIQSGMPELATKRLKKLLRSEDENVALKAIQEVYDRTYGKAPQQMKLTGGLTVANLNLQALDDEQLGALHTIVLAAEGAVEQADPGGDPAPGELQEDGGGSEGR